MKSSENKGFGAPKNSRKQADKAKFLLKKEAKRQERLKNRIDRLREAIDYENEANAAARKRIDEMMAEEGLRR